MKRALLALLLASACQAEPPEAKPRPVPFSLAPDAMQTLTIGDGVRIVLRGPGHFELRGEQLLANGGLVSVDVAAQHTGQRSFTVSTPVGQVVSSFAARFVLLGRELALISGEAAVAGLSVGARTRVCLAGTGPHVVAASGFATVEAALAALPGSHACADEAAPDLATLDRELAEQLDSFESAKEDQEFLIHHPSREMTFLQRLTELGQRMLAVRTRVIALRGQLGAAQLGAANDPERSALLTRAWQVEPLVR